MNGKKAKALRRKVTGDPDFTGRMFYHRRVVACDLQTHQEIVDPKCTKTLIVHPMSPRGQYKQAKKEAGR